MSDPRTLRILELDGGGERGYLSLKFLQRFIQLWGIPQNELWKHFDIICGTSIGGLQALSYAYGLGPDDIESFFTDDGPNIFTIAYPISSVRPNAIYKVLKILGNIAFYDSSVGLLSDYWGSGLLKKRLIERFGADTLQNLRTNVIIPSYEFDTSTYALFSNLNYPDFVGQNELISNVGLATSAAPVYLPPAIFNGHIYKDGGIYNNNPGQLGLTLGKMIKPNANRYCVFSLGTGIGEMGFYSGGEPPPPEDTPSSFDPFATIQEIFSLFNIASTGSQESTSKSLYLESTYSLGQLYYYRFQPTLDPDLNTELDNTDPSFLLYLENLADQVFNDDIDDISTFLGHLTA